MNAQAVEKISLEALSRSTSLLIESSALQATHFIHKLLANLYSLPSLDQSLLSQDDHPDFHVLDGREMSPQDVRDVRSFVSALPSRLPARHLHVVHLDRFHTNALQTLLKLLEEPYTHLRVSLSTISLYRVPLTIISRSIKVQLPLMSFDTLEALFTARSYSEPAWRAEVARSFPDAGEDFDIPLSKEWHRLCSAWASGAPPLASFVWEWTAHLTAASYSTQLILWSIFLDLSSRRLYLSLWREAAVLVLHERERLLNGKTNKIQISTVLVRLYALLKTAAKVKR
jgi:hypothetical protein